MFPLGSGMWGCIAVGIFADPSLVKAAFSADDVSAGLIHGGYKLILAQLCGVASIVGWVSVIMVPYFYLLDVLALFRVDAIEEEVGLDISHHKGAAYDMGGPGEATLEKFELHRSQHKIDIPKDVDLGA